MHETDCICPPVNDVSGKWDDDDESWFLFPSFSRRSVSNDVYKTIVMNFHLLLTPALFVPSFSHTTCCEFQTQFDQQQDIWREEDRTKYLSPEKKEKEMESSESLFECKEMWGAGAAVGRNSATRTNTYIHTNNSIHIVHTSRHLNRSSGREQKRNVLSPLLPSSLPPVVIRAQWEDTHSHNIHTTTTWIYTHKAHKEGIHDAGAKIKGIRVIDSQGTRNLSSQKWNKHFCTGKRVGREKTGEESRKIQAPKHSRNCERRDMIWGYKECTEKLRIWSTECRPWVTFTNPASDHVLSCWIQATFKQIQWCIKSYILSTSIKHEWRFKKVHTTRLWEWILCLAFVSTDW